MQVKLGFVAPNGRAKIDFNEFRELLELMALVAWHGTRDVRMFCMSDVNKYCDAASKLWPDAKSALQKLKNAKFSLGSMLLIFYFDSVRESEKEEVIEFIHKSFGEYLAACALVNQFSKIISNNNLDETDALKQWARFAGVSVIDNNTLEFLRLKITLLPQNQPKNGKDMWQNYFNTLWLMA